VNLAEAMTFSAADGDWLQKFHRGDRGTLESCYREHFSTVERAIGGMLSTADRETVTHEVFSRLLSQADLRQSFHGGSLAGWLTRVARNQAIDFRRRQGRELSATGEEGPDTAVPSWEASAEARLLVDRFRKEHLPAEWVGVFELRFLQQLPQREAASRLSIHRTTLAYRELRIRRLLRAFLLEEGDSR